jgi:hypothetical protein
MGLGLEGAYGAAGAADALRQLIKDRFERERQKHAQTIADQELALRGRTLDLNEGYRRDQQEENKRQHDLLNADRLFKENTALNETIQPLTPDGKPVRFSGSNPISGRLMSVGGARSAGIEGISPGAELLAAPGMSTEQPGTIANAPAPGMREYEKVETQKQYDTRTDNERQQAHEAAMLAAVQGKETPQAAEARRIREHAANRAYDVAHPTPPGPDRSETYEEWQKKYDYALTNPKAGAGGGAQGLQKARAESAQQMLDRLKTVHGQLNAGEGPGQLVRGTLQKVGGALNLSNAATEYRKLRRATAVALAVAIQGSRPSDADAEAMAQLLPDYNTPGEVAGNLFNSTNAQLQKTAEAMGGRAPLGSLKPVASHGPAPAAAAKPKKYEIIDVK